jgi:hypothetical protein
VAGCALLNPPDVILAAMPEYRRHRVAGGCYFFTVNLLERSPNDLLVRHIDSLRAAVREVRRTLAVPHRRLGGAARSSALHPDAARGRRVRNSGHG